MRVLIVGVSGDVGQSLARRLLACGARVYGTSRRLPSDEILRHREYDHISGSLGDRGTLDNLPLTEVDWIVYLAAAGVKAKTRIWPDCVEVNCYAPIEFLERVRFVKVGSGNICKLLYCRTYYEDHTCANGLMRENPYALTKAVCTRIFRTIAPSVFANVGIATLYNTFGKDCLGVSVIPYAIACFRNKEIAEFGSGKAKKDWIYIDDAIDVLLLAMDSNWSRCINEFDVGTGKLTSVKDLILMIADIMGVSSDYYVFNSSNDRDDQSIEDCASAFLPDWQPNRDLRGRLEKMLLE